MCYPVEFGCYMSNERALFRRSSEKNWH